MFYLDLGLFGTCNGLHCFKSGPKLFGSDRIKLEKYLNVAQNLCLIFVANVSKVNILGIYFLGHRVYFNKIIVWQFQNLPKYIAAKF